jgi:hypothetical protein
MLLTKIAESFKLMKFNNALDIAINLYTTIGRHFDLYKIFGHDIPLQTGGSVYEIDYNNTKIKFDKMDFGKESVIYTLYKSNDVSTRPECIIVMVNKKEKVSAIHNLSYDDKCFTSNNKKYIATNGSSLLKIALKLIDDIKDHYQLISVELIDNAKKKCENKKNIELWAIYMLTHGDTWYGKYGFVPKDDDKKILYQKNKKKMKKLLVTDTDIMDILKIYSKKTGYDGIYNNIDNMIKEYKNDKVTTLFMSLLMNYDNTCELFYYMYYSVMKNIGLYNLFNISYIKRL